MSVKRAVAFQGGRPFFVGASLQEHSLSDSGRIPTLMPFVFRRVTSLPRMPAIAAGVLCALHAFAQPAPRRWSITTELQSSFGYKDNVLLSSSHEEASTFARGGVELLFLHLPNDRFDYTIFAQTNYTRFLTSDRVKDEADAWVQAEGGARLLDTLKLSLPLTGYYFDQVFDESDTDAERRVAELKVTGMMIGPTLRWTFHRNGWLEAQAVGERKRYEDRVNDFRGGEGALRLGWRLAERVEARLSGTQRWRDFDDRVQYTAVGRALSGTHLKIAEHEGELRVDVEWDAARRWQTSTRVAALRYRDNGSGYFSYEHKKVSHELEWDNDVWLVRIGGAAVRVDFDVQKVGFGIEPPPRIKDEFSAELRVERKLARGWSVFGEYNWERSRSNDPVASYRVNEGLLGAAWSWDK